MVTLLLGIHNHQPVGNFDHVLEKASRLAYQPFLDVLKKHPHIRLSLHQSGILYDWMERSLPGYLDDLASLIKEGRVEALGGGYYEPILALLPEKDQKGQVGRMTAYLKRKFGVKPRGFWLAERVWEPQLPQALGRLGFEYTVVDDAHFQAGGFAEEELSGYFLTECGGRTLKVFPISKRLRYMIPYAPPERVLEFLLGFGRDREEVALVMADDGEKFGLWPRTHDHVYGDGWLERFFTLLEERRDQIQTLTLSEWLDRARPRGWAYLPTCSYFELSEWALGPDAGRALEAAFHIVPEEHRRFVRGGYFRNFFTKYPEAGLLYRKMLRVSRKVHAAKLGEEALNDLWQGQCNCPYWHGVFGGLYLPHLRGAVYGHLLRAEGAADRAAMGEDNFRVQAEDWDADGVDELLVDSPEASWYLAPGRGGGLWEWGLKSLGLNLGGLVCRRPEAYHDKVKQAVVLSPSDAGARSIHDILLAKEPDLDKLLHYDWHARMSLLDHFLHPDTDWAGFSSARYGEQGDFVLGAYAASVPVLENGRLGVTLGREGRVWTGKRQVAVRIDKRVAFSKTGGWECAVTLEAAEAADFWYGTEVAVFLSDAAVGGAAEERGVRERLLRDRAHGVEVRLKSDLESDLWAFPLYTVQQSEEGFEKTYQGTVFLFHRKISLAPREPRTFVVSVEGAPLAGSSLG